MDMLNNMSDYNDMAEREGMSVIGLIGFLARFYVEMTPFFFVTVDG